MAKKTHADGESAKVASSAKTPVPLRLFKDWAVKQSVTSPTAVNIYAENDAKRSAAVQQLKDLLIEHFVGNENVLKAGGFAKALGIIQESLPTGKKARSGDLGELLAAEFVNSETTYKVAVAKLQWKSDKETALHGNDIIGIRITDSRIEAIKGECKSRQSFKPSDAQEALTALKKHDGRPNPASVAFIAKRLYEQERDEEANVYRDLLTGRELRAKDLTHLVFVLSGNVPSAQLATVVDGKHKIQRQGAAVVVKDHADFIKSVFED